MYNSPQPTKKKPIYKSPPFVSPFDKKTLNHTNIYVPRKKVPTTKRTTKKKKNNGTLVIHYLFVFFSFDNHDLFLLFAEEHSSENEASPSPSPPTTTNSSPTHKKPKHVKRKQNESCVFCIHFMPVLYTFLVPYIASKSKSKTNRSNTNKKKQRKGSSSFVVHFAYILRLHLHRINRRR